MATIIEQTNSMGRTFVEFAWPMLLQSSVLILILLLVDLGLRKRVRAVFRYWILMIVLVKLVLPTSLSSPVSLGYLFGDKLPALDARHSRLEPEAVEPAPAISPPIIDLTNIDVTGYTEPVKPIPQYFEPVAREPLGSPEAGVTPLTWQAVAFLAWLAVAAAMGLLLLQRALFVRRLVAQAKDANRPMNEMLEDCCRCMGIRRKVGLKVSANAASPAVCGLFRPVILVPQNLARSLGPARLRTVLLHELAHIKRRDLWVNLAQTALQVFYFYNPLFWLANAMIRRVREQAVDEAVLVAMGETAQQYPQTLVDVAKLAFKRPALSLRLIGVVESRSALAGRIKRILNRPVPKTAKLGILGLLTIIITAAVLLPMAKADKADSQTMQTIAPDEAKEDWGKEAEGVRCRLQADRLVWEEGQSPTLKADIRNYGNYQLRVVPAHQRCILILDGKTYSWPTWEYIEMQALPPGSAYRNILIPLVNTWAGGIPLKLNAGLHTVRVIFQCQRTNSRGETVAIDVQSNTLVIEIVAKDKPDVQVEINQALRESHIQNQVLSFGPEVKRILGLDCAWIDLERGTTQIPPSEESSNEAQLQWCRERGVDVVGRMATGRLDCLDIQMVKLDDQAWTGLSVDALSQELKSDNSIRLSNIDGFPAVALNGKSEKGTTYGFRTREGTLGLLKIDDLWSLEDGSRKDNPNLPAFITILYKLALSPAMAQTVILERQLSLVEQQYLDLDSGQYVTIPRSEMVTPQHLMNRGVDLYLTYESLTSAGPPATHVNSLGMAMTDTPHKLYLQQISVDAVREALTLAIAHLNQPRWITGHSTSGTYAFRTAQGKAGVMRINWPSSGEPPKCLVKYRFLPALDLPIEKFPWALALEGVQCRLRARKTIWGAGEIPTLSFDLRNRGEKTIDFVSVAQAHCEIQIDGAWYGWAEPIIIDAPVRRLEPLTELNDAISIKLTNSWALPRKTNKLKHLPGVSEFWGKRLELTPGKHTVRVRFRTDDWLQSYMKNESSLSVVSNPVEIEILPAERKPDVQVAAEKPENTVELTQLLEELQDASHLKREEAARKLGELRDTRAVEALIAALKDTDVGVRGAAARALGKIADKRAVEPLIAAYHDQEYESFIDAIWALGDVGGPRAEQTLVDALSYQGYHPYVTNIAAKCLTNLGWKPETRRQTIRYLMALQKWDQAIKSGPCALLEPEGTNQAEGPFELNIPIVIPLEAEKQTPAIYKCPWLQFSTAQGRLKAALHVRYSSWPHTKWAMKLDVLDAGGKVLGQSESIHSNSGIIETYPHVESAEILFEFDRPVDPANAAMFRFSIESFWTSQGNPIQFGKELPLALELSSAKQSQTIRAQWVKFEKNDDLVEATIHLKYLSWPKAKWEVGLRLLDPNGKHLSSPATTIENRGIVLGLPATHEKDLRFSLGSWRTVSQAVRYVVQIQRILGSTAKTDVQVEGEEEVSKLVEQLQSENRRERCQAALKLESLGDRRGVPAIIKELKDTSYRPTDRIKSDGREDQEGQVRQDRYYAALLLGTLGDKRAVPALIEATRDETIDYQAAMSLGQIGDKRAIPALHDMLERCSNKPFPRLFAGYGLAMLGDKEGLKVVIDTLNNQQVHWTNRRHAIEALGKLHDKDAVPYLIAALKDEHPNIRVSAAEALGAIGDLSALPALKQALEDKTETKVNAPTTVSEAAAKAIAQIEGCGSAVEGEEGWGEVVNGLRAAVEFVPEKESYVIGERVKIRHYVQNVSDGNIQIASTTWRQDQAFATDGEGHDVRVDCSWFSGWPRIVRHVLKPGQTVVLDSSGLRFGDADDPALVQDLNKRPLIGNLVRCEPGQYFIYYRVDLPDVEGQSHVDEKDNVPQPGDWRGVLETGRRNVTITPMPPSHPETFKLMLERQSMRNAILEFAQTYRARVCFEDIDYETNPELETNRHLLTGTFSAPTIPELLDKLIQGSPFTSERLSGTYVVYPKDKSLLRFPIKINISQTLLESVVRRILDQDPYGKQIDVKMVSDEPRPNTYLKGHVRRLWISRHHAMYALSRAVEQTDQGDIVWMLTEDDRQRCLLLQYLPQAEKSGYVRSLTQAWKDVGELIPVDFNDTKVLADGITLGAIGQDVEQKAFVTCICDGRQTEDRQHRFVLVRKDGTRLLPSGYGLLAPKDGVQQKFSFDVPLLRQRIEGFHFQSKPASAGVGEQVWLAPAERPAAGDDSRALVTSDISPPGQYALSFDGVDDYLLVPHSDSLRLEPPFTVEMWIKPEFPAEQLEHWPSWAVIAQGCYVGTGKVKSRGFGIKLGRLRDRPDQLMIDYCVGNDRGIRATTYATSRFDDWTHIYHVFGGDDYEPGHGHPLVVGKFLIPSENAFKGQVGEIRIWNTARTRQEIQRYRNVALTGNEPGLVACWTLEQTKGEFAYDISPNKNHARLGRAAGRDYADPEWVELKAGDDQPKSKIDVQTIAEKDEAPSEAESAVQTGQPAAIHAGRIRGVAVSSVTGEPVSGAYVGVGDFGDSGGSNYARHREQGFHDKTETDQKGRFELDGLVLTDRHPELDFHPLVVTHPNFVRHDQKVKLPSSGPVPDILVHLRPAARIDVTVVDSDGGPIEGHWLLRLEALDGRRFIPPGSDPHLSSFASSIWAQWPDMRKKMGLSPGFTFTELDTGDYSIEAIRFHLADNPTPQNIWKPTVTYHGSIPSLKIQAGQTKEVKLPPQDYQTRLTVTPPEFPDMLMGKLKRSRQMQQICLLSRNPGLLLWDDGKVHHLEDQRLGRIDKKRFFRGFFPQAGPLTINNLPPGPYALFAVSVYGQVAACLIGARVDIAKGDDAILEIPWRQPEGPSLVGPNRAFDYPVKLEAKEYTVAKLCEILTKMTDSNPRLIAERSIEHEKLKFDGADMSIWDLLEKLFLDKGWKLQEGSEKTLVLRPR